MPYNNAAIPPRHEATGTTQLPLSRIKKIIGTDQDINMCSNNAAFVITLATEMFIQYMAESGHNVVKSERKPRRNIQYRDLSSAVSHIDNLEFLSDIIPRTVPLKVVKARAHIANTLIQAQPTNPLPTPPHRHHLRPLNHPRRPLRHKHLPPPLDTAPPCFRLRPPRLHLDPHLTPPLQLSTKSSLKPKPKSRTNLNLKPIQTPSP
ncbi:68d33099-3ee7-4b94-9028-5cbbc179bcdc [Sclerotinia trifoliorum]|uniref:68d33099-3ee7-4b94-9028-5cbbc179bcdc n=1 Tax=Sclerotinia trifoliorum TaxID=28548 RepID=A0A8H2ZTI4_9HELO|nr:68d33099-3ee7-4b94-9028-5cbbc179bcdc [Sclerotinia trifoliorum]